MSVNKNPKTEEERKDQEAGAKVLAIFLTLIFLGLVRIRRAPSAFGRVLVGHSGLRGRSCSSTLRAGYSPPEHSRPEAHVDSSLAA